MANFAWRRRGAKMPRCLRRPSCIGPLGSWYSKVTGAVTSPLPSYGPAEGSILDVFEPMSGLAETAHFQLPTPTGIMAGPYLPLREELRSAIKGRLRTTVCRCWSRLITANWPVAGCYPPTSAGFWGLVWSGPWVVFEPRTSKRPRRWDLGMGYGWRLSVFWPEGPLPQSMA